MRLTKRTIDAADYRGENNARHVLWDSEVPGFGCRIYPGGERRSSCPTERPGERAC